MKLSKNLFQKVGNIKASQSVKKRKLRKYFAMKTEKCRSAIYTVHLNYLVLKYVFNKFIMYIFIGISKHVATLVPTTIVETYCAPE